MLSACLAVALSVTPAMAGGVIDGARSQAHFSLRVGIGRRVIEGRFNQVEGRLHAQPDGFRRVLVRLPVADADIPGHPRYTRLMRGGMFFDGERHPEVRFHSDPFDPGVLARGGDLQGLLTLRGVSRRERLRVRSDCPPPDLRGCTFHAVGRVSRADYGMHHFRGLIDDVVEFDLRIVAGPAS